MKRTKEMMKRVMEDAHQIRTGVKRERREEEDAKSEEDQMGDGRKRRKELRMGE